ncbi:MAG: hypothetical protein SV765_07700 [Pseudomonadota bacterium]|nr:hypothetical protein [Pseudomonadales bacterium]MDY6920081.1 hypothetical protein [Pseudomonadota bacterium]
MLEQIGRDKGATGPMANSVARQDPYWQRFYELEQKIAELQARLRTAPGPVTETESDRDEPPGNPGAAFLERLRGRTDQALARLDAAIAALTPAPDRSLADSNEPAAVVRSAPPTAAPAAVAGSLQRNQAGKVVQQTNRSQSRQQRYNYSLVYTYAQPQPWNAMWERLEALEETDKWRGSNPAKPSYFIYVGAYLRQQDARKRHDQLAALVGEGPELRPNPAQASALASNN